MGPAFEGPCKILQRLGDTSLKLQVGTYANGVPRVEIRHWRSCQPAKFTPNTDAVRPTLGRPKNKDKQWLYYNLCIPQFHMFSKYFIYFWYHYFSNKRYQEGAVTLTSSRIKTYRLQSNICANVLFDSLFGLHTRFILSSVVAFFLKKKQFLQHTEIYTLFVWTTRNFNHFAASPIASMTDDVMVTGFSTSTNQDWCGVNQTRNRARGECSVTSELQK